MSSEPNDQPSQPEESQVDVSLLKEIARKALVDALNSVRQQHGVAIHY